jgi:hypothetical protein
MQIKNVIPANAGIQRTDQKGNEDNRPKDARRFWLSVFTPPFGERNEACGRGEFGSVPFPMRPLDPRVRGDDEWGRRNGRSWKFDECPCEPTSRHDAPAGPCRTGSPCGHPGPFKRGAAASWRRVGQAIRAGTSMNEPIPLNVIPANAGIQRTDQRGNEDSFLHSKNESKHAVAVNSVPFPSRNALWIPAYAGMTSGGPMRAFAERRRIPAETNSAPLPHHDGT